MAEQESRSPMQGCDDGLAEPRDRPLAVRAGDGDVGMATGSVIPQPTLGSANPSAAYTDILAASDALRRVQKGRVWFEPYSDCLDPIIEAIKALDELAGYDNVRRGGANPMNFRRAANEQPTNDRERILLAEITRLRKERDEAVESSHYYLAEYKRVYGDWVAAREFYLSHDDQIEDALKITPKGVDLGWNA